MNPELRAPRIGLLPAQSPLPSRQSLWDGLPIDVHAEFEPTKMTLAQIKALTEGDIVDVSAIVPNTVRLHVDGRTVATGELVLVGNQFGVLVKQVATQDDDTSAPDRLSPMPDAAERSLMADPPASTPPARPRPALRRPNPALPDQVLPDPASTPVATPQATPGPTGIKLPGLRPGGLRPGIRPGANPTLNAEPAPEGTPQSAPAPKLESAPGAQASSDVPATGAEDDLMDTVDQVLNDDFM